MSREDDAKIAQKRHKEVPFYTTASADYEVLKWVRENWDQARREKFSEELSYLWHVRDVETNVFIDQSILYQPGDYSFAALKVMEEENHD